MRPKSIYIYEQVSESHSISIFRIYEASTSIHSTNFILVLVRYLKKLSSLDVKRLQFIKCILATS